MSLEIRNFRYTHAKTRNAALNGQAAALAASFATAQAKPSKANSAAKPLDCIFSNCPIPFSLFRRRPGA